MSNFHNQKVAFNIHPLSIEKEDLSKAIEEWSATGFVIDHEHAEEKCQLCDHENLRYHFRIENDHNHNTLDVGSTCITKFGVKVFDDYGNELKDKKAIKKRLAELLKNKQNQYASENIQKVITAETEAKYLNLLEKAQRYFHNNKKLTSRYMHYVRWRGEINGVDVRFAMYDIDLRNNDSKKWLKNAEDWQILKQWDCYTSAQKRTVRGWRTDIDLP